MAEVVNFGCRLNAAEGEAIRGLAAHLVDTVVFNTCAVTGAAEREARQAIARLHRARPGAGIVVTGCAAQIAPEAWAGLPGVVRVLGNQEKLRAQAWRGTGSEVGDIGLARGHAAVGGAIAGRARAFVDVQQGCDHACTFCIIPQGRGPSRGVPAEAVVRRLEELAAAGMAEVVLTGVDLASWREGGARLGDLVLAVLRGVPGLRRLRLSSLDPAALDPALWDALAGEERLMPHLHLSMQSGADLVLKRMRRRHSAAQAREVIDRARALRPGLAVGLDLIAGFPTETEAQAAATLGFLEAAAIPYAHVFPYSARPGTPAARMRQVPQAERQARAAALRAAAARHAAAWHAGMVGREVEVVAERGGRGHTQAFAPVRLRCEAAPGQLVRGRVLAGDAAGVEVG